MTSTITSSFVLISLLSPLLFCSLISANDGSQLIFHHNHDPTLVNLNLSSPQNFTGTLSKWARDARSQFFSDVTQNRAGQWIIVMGNEAGDTDSMAAALAWAYHISHLAHNPQKAIALLQTVEDALDLRPENQLALERSQMSPRHRDLLTIDELPIKPFELSHRLAGIVLVDHNIPGPGWKNAPLLSIIDHHADQQMNLSAIPRLIEKSASCTSLVATLMLESEAQGHHRAVSGEKHGIPTDLVDLMLRAIFLDSAAMSSNQYLKVDQRAAFGLFRLSQWYTLEGKKERHKWEKAELRKLATTFWEEMNQARGQLEQLDLRDLLRRDWKVNAVRTQSTHYPYLTLGFASIPYSIRNQVDRTPEKTVPEWFAIERAFTSEVGADVSVVLAKSKSESTGKAEREIMLVVAHGWGKRLGTEAATDLFLALCRAIESEIDGLEEWSRPDNKPLLPRRKGWKIRTGVPVNRKLLMPLMLHAASNWTWQEPTTPIDTPSPNAEPTPKKD